MPAKIEMAGKRFGRLIVIGQDGYHPGGKTPTIAWLCQCDCGNTVRARGRHLREGMTKSCGCSRRLERRPIDQAYVRERLSYDPATGIFTWRMHPSKKLIGTAAGWRQSKGYLAIDLQSTAHYAHRLAWLWMTGEWPAEQIDHIDGNKADNAWANLRLATNSQNQRYQGVSRANECQFKGVFPQSGRKEYGRTGRFRAQIRVDGRTISLGSFSSPDEAHEAYKRAAALYHGPFAKW